MKMRNFRIASTALGLLAFFTVSADAFYAGKTIRFIVGYAAGGGYDTYTRAIARHIGEHIPGNPATVVENMPGAGSLVLANHIANKAEPDGLTVGIWNSQFVLLQALGDKNVRFNPRDIEWIGTPSTGTPTCAVMGFTGLKNFQDVLNTTKPIRMGGTRAGAISVDLPTILNRTLGTKFEIITGYKGSADYQLAMQKGEVDGACVTWESLRATAIPMLNAKGKDRLIPFMIHRRWDEAYVKDLPLIPELIKGEDKRATYRAWAAHLEFFRPFTLPPDTPQDRVAILRKAFQATVTDPDFLREAKKSKLDIDYVSAEEVEKYVEEILSIRPAAKENLAFLVRKAK
ncbi:MAG TPA: tripartite tricarboxylate transporter substrate-binding protein [Candidatus Eisenbacteria bacterium]|nr:tripartite tricarboxylate transporter substrate-binding protein [Candidatus Eisenbacteria bacterium]